MNELSSCSTPRVRSLRGTGSGKSSFGAAGLALVLTLAACAHTGTDDVKPTATTAYHSGAPAAQQPSPAAPAPARE